MDVSTQADEYGLNIEHGPSAYGEVGEVKRMIAAAKQYNPAAGRGLNIDGTPSKKGMQTVPEPRITEAANPPAPSPAPTAELHGQGPATPVGGSRRGFGASSGLGDQVAPLGHPFASGDMATHFRHLASLPDASPEILWYAQQLGQGGS